VTPKSYLNFISGYKTIYQRKQRELSDGAERMDTGLSKLKDASQSVEVLKQELAVMEQELALASAKAEQVLKEVTERATQAEQFKNQVQKVKEKAEALVHDIALEKAVAEEKLEAAKPALEEAEAALNTIKPAHIGFHIVHIYCIPYTCPYITERYACAIIKFFFLGIFTAHAQTLLVSFEHALNHE
jgi:dynein heavy chain, axonemal